MRFLKVSCLIGIFFLAITGQQASAAGHRPKSSHKSHKSGKSASKAQPQGDKIIAWTVHFRGETKEEEKAVEIKLKVGDPAAELPLELGETKLKCFLESGEASDGVAGAYIYCAEPGAPALAKSFAVCAGDAVNRAVIMYIQTKNSGGSLDRNIEIRLQCSGLVAREN